MNLKVGGEFTGLANRPEGVYFEITESGPVLIFNYFHPSQKEIDAVSEGAAFEIREMVMGHVLWIFAKCQDQNWVEAPYHPGLSKSPTLPEPEGEDDGYGLTVMMVDAGEQVIKRLRLIGLDNRFSRQLKKDVDELARETFSQQAHNDTICKAQMVYTTKQMANLCKNKWKL